MPVLGTHQNQHSSLKASAQKVDGEAFVPMFLLQLRCPFRASMSNDPLETHYQQSRFAVMNPLIPMYEQGNALVQRLLVSCHVFPQLVSWVNGLVLVPKKKKLVLGVLQAVPAQQFLKVVVASHCLDKIRRLQPCQTSQWRHLFRCKFHGIVKVVQAKDCTHRFFLN